MDLFFSIVFESLSCIFYGMIITAFIMTTLFFLLKNLSSGVYRSVAFYITGIILTFLLTMNTTILIGAIRIKNETEAMRLWLKQQLYGAEGFADLRTSQQIGTDLTEQFPLLKCFFNLFDMSGNTMNDLPQIFYETINSEVNHIILNKSLWSLAFIVAAILVALYFTKETTGSETRSRKRPNRSNHRSLDDF